MTYLRVLDCGPASSVQDAGRFGYRRYGVSTAGAMDHISLSLANALVGNAPHEAAVELVLSGGRFELQGGAALCAVAGGGAELLIDGRPVAPLHSACAYEGSILQVRSPNRGVFAYLSFSGAVKSPCVMGSRATHRRTGLGGAPLQPGDRLPLDDGEAFTGEFAPLRLRQPQAPARQPSGNEIRILPAPQLDAFPPDALSALDGAEFTIDALSDRMAYRLRGAAPIRRCSTELVSDGVTPGSLQIPGDGTVLVLMRDCQTTGGYPKIANVISADLHHLAQIPPGQRVRLRQVTHARAVSAARGLKVWMNSLKHGIDPALTEPDVKVLLGCNLISGVTDGKS